MIDTFSSLRASRSSGPSLDEGRALLTARQPRGHPAARGTRTTLPTEWLSTRRSVTRWVMPSGGLAAEAHSFYTTCSRITDRATGGGVVTSTGTSLACVWGLRSPPLLDLIWGCGITRTTGKRRVSTSSTHGAAYTSELAGSRDALLRACFCRDIVRRFAEQSSSAHRQTGQMF